MIVFGPAGIPIWETSFEEIDLELEDVTPSEVGHPEEATIWAMSNDHWSTTTLEGTFLSNLGVLPDGRFAASGWGPGGVVRMISTDGVSWDQSVPDETAREQIVIGPDGGIAIEFHQNGSGVLFSEDLEVWEPLGLDEILPDVIDWWYNPVVLNDYGIALFAHGNSNRFESNQPQTTFIARNGYELVFRPEAGNLTLRFGGDEVLRLPSYGATVPEAIVVNIPAKTMTFLHPDTDESLATFTFSEITALETDAYRGLGHSNNFTAFLHTTDGVNWLVQDLPLIPDTLQIMDMVITKDQVILTAIDTFSFAAFSTTPDLQILVGDLP